jgi:hypothetical protein
MARSEAFKTVRALVGSIAAIPELDYGGRSCSGVTPDADQRKVSSMQPRSGLALAILSIVLAAIVAAHPAAAFDFTVSNPVVRGNLAVYPVHGAGSGGGNLLTLDEAAQQGAVKIQESENGPLQIANASDRGLFVQAGTLLVGGLQDQVVSADTIVGPHSTRSLYTFCVDPFRCGRPACGGASIRCGAG